jgi:hypothetical protein
MIQKYPKLTLRATLKRISMVRYPIKKLTAVITKIVKISKLPNIEPSPKIISTPIDAIITGTDIKKLRLRDLSCS